MNHQINVHQNERNHGYYKIGESPIKYDLLYPLGDALNLISMGIGPESCNNCLVYGTLKGIMVCPCLKCLRLSGRPLCNCCNELPDKLFYRRSCDNMDCISRFYLKRVDINLIGCDTDSDSDLKTVETSLNECTKQIEEKEDFDYSDLPDLVTDSDDSEDLMESDDSSVITIVPCQNVYIGPYKGIIQYSADRKERTVIDISNSTTRKETCNETIVTQKYDTIEVIIEYSKNGKTQYIYDKETDELISKYTVGEKNQVKNVLKIIHPESIDYDVRENTEPSSIFSKKGYTLQYSDDRKTRILYDKEHCIIHKEKCPNESLLSQKECFVQVFVEYSINKKKRFVYDALTEELIATHNLE